MGYSEINSNLKDTVQLKIGNIEPYEEIFIKLRYIEALRLNASNK